jgi:DNA-3-methyladenine glycosylase I
MFQKAGCTSIFGTRRIDMTRTRCGWTGSDAEMIEYHDTEWGTPLSDDRKLFEFMVLEGAQAGLSWSTVLRKRENYRSAFDGFDPEKVATYDESRVEELLSNPGIIRNRLKVRSAVSNAGAFLRVAEEFGSFSEYMWRFVDGKPVMNGFGTLADIPATSEISDCMSKELRKRGFKFMGSTICYAHMQAVGMVNDHLVSCFRYPEIEVLAASFGP